MTLLALPLLAVVLAAPLVGAPAPAPGTPPAPLPAPPPGVAAPETAVDVSPGPRWDVPLAHTGAVLLGMRVGLSVLWPSHFDPLRFDAGLQGLRAAYTRPPEFLPGRPLLESDGDPLVLNTLGHGLFGAEVYGRTRACGHAPGVALLTTAAASTTWEYVLEAPYQRPSALDLVWTPLVGSLLGEGRFQLQQALRLGASPRARVGGLRGVLLWVVDPLGEVERQVLRTGC